MIKSKKIDDKAERRKMTSNHRWKKLNCRPLSTSVIMTRYSAGMFILKDLKLLIQLMSDKIFASNLMSSTEEQKYIPISWARIRTMMLLDLLEEIL